MKNKLMVSFLALVLVACGSSGSLELSKQEKEKINGDVNVARQILVQKAILKEASTEKLSDDDKYNIQQAKDEVEVSYYLQKKFGAELNNIQVSEEEAQKYYDIHKAEIGNHSYEEVRDAIVGQIAYEKQTAIVNKYYEDLLNKYQIEEILKKDFPEAAQPTVETPAPAAEATPATEAAPLKPAQETKSFCPLLDFIGLTKEYTTSGRIISVITVIIKIAGIAYFNASNGFTKSPSKKNIKICIILVSPLKKLTISLFLLKCIFPNRTPKRYTVIYPFPPINSLVE